MDQDDLNEMYREDVMALIGCLRGFVLLFVIGVALFVAYLLRP